MHVQYFSYEAIKTLKPSSKRTLFRLEKYVNHFFKTQLQSFSFNLALFPSTQQ